MGTTEKKIAIIDLTRLYFDARSLKLSIDYEKLSDVLDADKIIGFTSANEKNEGQMDFIESLELQYGYSVHSRPIWLATIHEQYKNSPPPAHIRFDADVAFLAAHHRALGKDVTIVTSSFALASSFAMADQLSGGKLSIAGFRQAMEQDSRWRGILDEVDFIDLSQEDVTVSKFETSLGALIRK